MGQENNQSLRKPLEKTGLHLKTTENEVAVERYNKLKALGKELFKDARVVELGKVTDADVVLAKDYIAEGAKISEPEVWSSYWSHVILAPELGKRIASQIKDSEINPSETEFILWLHDIGRLVLPSGYFRNDLIGDRLLKEVGLPQKIMQNFPSNKKLMEKTDQMELTENQLSFKEALTPDQEKQAQEYFDSLSPIQKIVNFADNLGKRGKEGVFDVDTFLLYLKSQEGRYDQESHWASINWAIKKRKSGAVLQAVTIKKTIEWLEGLGVGVNEILKSLQNYGPKLVMVIRHGDLNNPTNVVYNRDSVMETPIHLSEHGIKQMRSLGELITSKQFKPKIIYTSPETRAKESTQELNSKLEVSDIEVVDDLDDGFLPGPYLERMKMNELVAIGGDVYDKSRWEKYRHESVASITKRMHGVFDKLASTLKVGEIGAMVSHGDPIALLANTLDTDVLPKPVELRDKLYPGKGEAIVVVIGPDKNTFTYYLFNENSVNTQRKIVY